MQVHMQKKRTKSLDASRREVKAFYQAANIPDAVQLELYIHMPSRKLTHFFLLLFPKCTIFQFYSRQLLVCRLQDNAQVIDFTFQYCQKPNKYFTHYLENCARYRTCNTTECLGKVSQNFAHFQWN